MKENTSHHVHAVMKAAVSALPMIGDPLSSLLGDYLPNRRLQRLERFIKHLSAALENVVVKLDDESFAFLIEKGMRVAAADHRQFKRAMLASAICAAATDASAVAVSKARTFIDLIDALEPHHVALLQCLGEAGTADFPTLRAALPMETDVQTELRDDLAVQALAHLCNAGLVRSVDPKDFRVLRVMNPASMWKLGKYGISNLGQEFIGHLHADTRAED